MPKFSLKGIDLPESPIRNLMPYAIKAKKKGIKILHLNIGQPDINSPLESLDLIKKNKLKLVPYGSSEGSINYRKSLCEYYSENKIHISPNDILITTGASEALTFTLNCICDAGDEIIIPEPFYANYNGFASAANVKVIPIVSLFENNFTLPSKKLIVSKITKKTKAILICNPNNPTGHLYSRKELEILGEIAIKNDIFIIVDEVYREFLHEDKYTHHSILKFNFLSQNSIMIDSVSKRYSLCGARIGCLISKNKKLISTALKFAHLRLSPPTYGMIASEAALLNSKKYIIEVKKEYTKRRNILINEILKIQGVEISIPMGAFYCIARLPVDDSEKFSKWLLTDFSYNNETVMFAPASGFYSTPGYGKKEIRIGFVLNIKKIIRAVKILEKALIAYNN
ncbi:MAG: pyridoxal phosphate-dependent aminotransferase [Flavobacteriaceae bacterium]|nr:pyridoxal phosphate-dependent aminotransferase [Flavobacteriaceae bacterium]